MNKVNDNKHLDNELADYTDRVLAGDEMNASTETQAYAYLVRQLSELVGTDDEPRPEFRMKLESALKDELKQLGQPSLTAQTQHEKRQVIVQSLRRRRYQQYAGLAALFITVIGVAYLMGGDGNKAGTVTDSPLTLFGAMFVLFAIAWAVNTYWERRQK